MWYIRWLSRNFIIRYDWLESKRTPLKGPVWGPISNAKCFSSEAEADAYIANINEWTRLTERVFIHPNNFELMSKSCTT